MSMLDEGKITEGIQKSDGAIYYYCYNERLVCKEKSLRGIVEFLLRAAVLV